MSLKISEKSQDLLIKAGLIAIAYIVIAKPIFNKLGITKSKADRIREKELGNPDSPFKTDFWKRYFRNPSKPTAKLFNVARYTQIFNNVKLLYDAFGYWTDDEEAVAAIMYDLKTKAEVSIFSNIFQNEYKKDLLTYLAQGKDLMPQNGLGDYDLGIIMKYVASLKNS